MRAHDGHLTGELPQLVVGPLLRYVDEHQATIWVETDRPTVVTVDTGGDGHRHDAPTWSVHGHHYALVRIEDLSVGSVTPYTIELDGRAVWPPADAAFPPSVIRTPGADASYLLAFGSCRRSSPFDEQHLDELGADALVALAGRMVAVPHDEWPDILLLLGDQVYADDPSDEIVARLAEANRDTDAAMAGEIQDFEEYTWLYQEAWTAPAVRWLLSTVPTGMLLDDHDLRDDWNTSLSWRRTVTAQPWWHDRVVGAYGSYWVYQHLGNLSPEQLDRDDVYERILAIDDDDERTRYLDDVAWQADVDASSIRWSYVRDLGGAGRGVRLVAIDSRCSRHLDPDDRRMVDAAEWAWVRDAVLDPDQPYDHLVLASTLPFLMIPGVHHMEGWDEAISSGAWGRPGKRFGEWLRQFLDLEHWAAFRESFDETTDLLNDVVARTAPVPSTILMLSGDVHCSYTAVAELTTVEHPGTAIHQLTMSPFRNDIEKVAKYGNRLLNRKGLNAVMHRLARWAHVEEVDLTWRVEHGPWFDNGVMTIEFAGRAAELSIDHAHVAGTDQRLVHTIDVELAAGAPSPDVSADEATASV
ncbi:MAG: alkaline phosphatase D family protein [Ilumatobacteraceae bacterium]